MNIVLLALEAAHLIAVPVWLVTVLTASSMLSLAAVVLLVILLTRKVPPARSVEDALTARHLAEVSARLDAALQLVSERLQHASGELASRLDATPLLTIEHLVGIAGQLGNLRHDLARVGAKATDAVALEHEVLGEAWKQFLASRELKEAYDAAVRDNAWEAPLLGELPKLVPDDLKPTFDTVVTPAREYRMLVQRLALIPRLANGDIPRRDTEAEELRRTRELAGLLASVHSSGDGAGRLTFRFKSWVTDAFLPFADQYLQRYQRARLQGRETEWQSGVKVVLQILRIAAVEPIDLTLGETAFDSTRHIGRSTSSDPQFSDGVITDVVRNGFIEGGRQIRQPEVVVNRMR